MIRQLPMRIRATHKSDVRTQFGALCYRVENGKVKILLITSRRSKRWIIPKGWPIDKLTPARSAAREAWEEAGVIGAPVNQCVGLYAYNKTSAQNGTLPCVVMVYPVRVKSLDPEFPEQNQRRVKWFSPKKAAARVVEPELARILRDFRPQQLR